MAIDPNQIINALIAGGAIYAGIRVEIKFIWRSLDGLLKRIERLEAK